METEQGANEMLKRLLVYSLLTALVNSTVGCTHMATIRTEEAMYPKHELAISQVELRPIIASLEASDQGSVQFDSTGGRFLLQERAFVGLDRKGDSVRVNFRTVTGVNEYRNFPDRTRSTKLDLSKFFKERREFKVYGSIDTVAPHGPRIYLADNSGRFSPEGSRFTGRTIDGYNVNIPTGDITASWTEEKRPDKVATILAVTVSLALVGGIIAAIAIGQSLQGGLM